MKKTLSNARTTIGACAILLGTTAAASAAEPAQTDASGRSPNAPNAPASTVANAASTPTGADSTSPAPTATPAPTTANPTATPPAVTAPASSAGNTPAPGLPTELPNDPRRARDLHPAPSRESYPNADGRIRFTADPVGDGALLGMAVGFDVVSNAILDTGEIRPQQIDPNFDTGDLLGIDRPSIHLTPSSTADTLSNVGLYTAFAFAVAQPIVTYARDGAQAALVEAVMYGEAIGFTIGLTNLAKIAFRRPRPIAYILRNEYIEGGGDPATYNNASTDSSVSFFSGHASQTAAVAATATYIAFSRSPKNWRPWLTLAGGLALTSFVSYERVQSAKHFPTDVIAGAVAGAGVGVLVVHLHREDSVRQRPIWIGVLPQGETGGQVSLSGLW